jgi:hypothetical protein
MKKKTVDAFFPSAAFLGTAIPSVLQKITAQKKRRRTP